MLRYAVDMWAVGCIIAEMFVGEQHLATRTRRFPAAVILCELCVLICHNVLDPYRDPACDCKRSHMGFSLSGFFRVSC